MALPTFSRGLTIERLVPRLIPFAATVLTPVAVYYLVGSLPTSQLEKACMAIIGAGAAIALSSRPGLVLVAALSGFPIVYVGQAILLKAGVQPGLVRGTAFWKEAVVVALAIAVWRNRDRLRLHKLDLIDWASLVFFVILVFYYLFPRQFPPIGTVATADGRLVAFRNLAVIPVGIAFARRLDFESVWVRRALTALMIGGSIYGAFSVWEIVHGDSFQRFVTETLDIDAVDRVLNRESSRARVETNVNGVIVHRAGSLFRAPNTAAFFFLPPTVAAVERLAREGGNPWTVAAVAGCGSGLLLTQTRSALLGAIIAILLIVRRQSGLAAGVRVRFVMVLAMVALAGAPFIAGSSIAERFTGAVTRSDTSSKAHDQRTTRAFRDVVENPFGRGLGSQGRTAVRFYGRAAGQAENYYLQVAQEIGLVAGLAFLVMVLGALAKLFGMPTGVEGVSATALSALLGLAVTAFFLHAFDGATITLPLFMLVGVGLGAGAAAAASPQRSMDARRDDEPVPVEVR